MERMMAAHGLHQPGDFQFVLAGAHPQRWEALKAGTLDAAIQLVPFNYVAEEAGFPNLGDVDDYVPDFLFCAVCTRLSWAQAHPKQLTGLLRAFRRGAEVLYGDPEAAAATIAGDTQGNPDHARRACRDLVTKKAIPKDLTITSAAFAATVDAMMHANLIAAGWPAADLTECTGFRYLAEAA
jgi:ABC-type nitrate/sulfonate/bicarbonate transport system substrate-binding protein